MNTRVESRGRNRIRGKKRIEIIQKFLEGEEDPKYEVVPTVTEGKYFVRPRKNESKSELKRHEMNERAQRALEGLCPEEEEEIERSKQKQQKQKQQKLKPELKQEQKQKKIHYDSGFGSLEPQDTTCPYDPTISYQILEQLKLLGEEQKLKREKKEQKKLVKATIRKQLKKQLKHKEPEPESEEYDCEEYESPERAQRALEGLRPEEEEPKLLFKPTPIRRKVNLNK